MNPFKNTFDNSEIILTEGAIVERLKSEYGLQMDKSINHAGLIYSNPDVLEFIYRQYVDIGRDFDVPIMVMTPTRRVNADSIGRSQVYGKDIIAAACTMLNRTKASYGSYADNVLIGGLLGCKGDAYCGKKKMDTERAYRFHSQQTKQFKRGELDFLFAGIMPEINEAKGMAQAMADTGIPYMISFMIGKDGRLLDGTLLTEAIKKIDEDISPSPVCYKANASSLSPEELSNCNILIQEDYDSMITAMCMLREQFDFKIFGGCCGTNDIFIRSLSEKLLSTTKTNK